MKLPHSLDIERTFLATLIKNPTIIPDYLEYLTDDLFYSEVHQTIAAAIRFQFANKKTVDHVILSDHISNIGLKNQGDIDIPDYIKTIATKSAVSIDKAEVYFRDCYKYKIGRLSIEGFRKAELGVMKAINGPISDVVAAAEQGAAKAVTANIEDEYKPVDIYADMDLFLEEQGLNPQATGIMTPFKTWNRWFGPLTVGDLCVIAAPPKTGKSTILNYIADAPFCKYNAGKRIKVLILDTELETNRVKTRKAAALTDVHEGYIKNGKWQKDAEMVDKITTQFEKMKKRAGFVKHQYVANVPIEKICSIVKRWAATECEPDDLKLVVYDYLKITGENISNFNQEWQVLGQKCDILKHLMSEVGAAGLAAVQTNAANDVAASQRIKWFASAVLFFTKKTPEEIAQQGEEFGTHTLHPFVLRNQGEDWDNEMYVKEQMKDGVKYSINKLQLLVKNFDMKECGTLEDVVKKSSEQMDITEGEDSRYPKKIPKVFAPEDDIL